uniref:Uncharacterized protein n=1 Tax=Anguilla anguilla TaxID=7936 RepID=A0A0E9XXZ3_ANGAN
MPSSTLTVVRDKRTL